MGRDHTRQDRGQIRCYSQQDSRLLALRADGCVPAFAVEFPPTPGEHRKLVPPLSTRAISISNRLSSSQRSLLPMSLRSPNRCSKLNLA
jgi:hypothetical protein